MSAAEPPSVAHRMGIGTERPIYVHTSGHNMSGPSRARTESASTNRDWPQSSSWRDIDARSAPFNFMPNHETSPTKNFLSSSPSTSSPPKGQTVSEAAQSQQQLPNLAAPRPEQSFARFTSPPPGDLVHSPSPQKRVGQQFPFGSDARERWSSAGKVQQSESLMHSHPPQQQQQQRKNMSGGPFDNEPFLGYSNIWGGTAPVNSQRGQDMDPRNVAPPGVRGSVQNPVDNINSRLDSASLGSSGDDIPSLNSAMHGAARGAGAQEGGQPPFAMGGIPHVANLSPQALMQYHHQQHMHAQQQQQQQIHQHQHQQQQSQQQQTQQASLPLQQSGPATATQTLEGGRNGEEITTVFIVGFPDDMGEREFANMFLFAKGFEASTLKVPVGGPSSIPGRPAENSGAGPGGPYSAVNMPGPASMFDSGAWDEQAMSMGIPRSGPGGDAYSSLPGMGGMSGNSAERNASNAAAGPGKIKQIIGFAKFRTRVEALEARDALNGRKIDVERGCVLKTEMAKKNLHTKQRPVLANTGPQSGEGANMNSGPVNSTSFSPQGANGPQPPVMHGPAGAFSGQSGATGPLPPPPPGMAGLPSGPGHGPPPPPGAMEGAGPGGFGGMRLRADVPHHLDPATFNSFAGPSAPPGLPKGVMHHGPYNSFSSAASGGPPGLQGPNSLASPPDGGPFSRAPRAYLSPGSEGLAQQQQQQDAGRGSGNSTGSGTNGPSGNADKWVGLGPLDFYEGGQSAPPPQNQQRAPQPGGAPLSATVNRGPDWSTLSSPPGLYRDAPGGGAGNKGANREHGPRDGSGSTSDGNSYLPFRAQREDFDQGESTVHTRLPSETVSLGSRPPPGYERKMTDGDGQTPASNTSQPPAAYGTSKASVIETPQTQPQQHPALPRPSSRTSARQGATSPPIRVPSRLATLRIDSPIMMQHKQQQNHRPFSPHAVLRSPSLAENGMMSPHAQIGAFIRASSPGSPPVSSPTSRSFSIDANPPGNTLFVGNLPASINAPPASTQLEEALYKIFSQKKGFRQMSFRVKSTGPMCFVEFDDVGCAGRALGAVNGDVLDGMVKGGLRLSFSKHPLFKGTSSSASSSTGHNRSNAATPQPQAGPPNGIAAAGSGAFGAGAEVTTPQEETPRLPANDAANITRSTTH